MNAKVARSIVGVELMGGEECEAIVEVARAASEATSIERFPGFVRVDVPDRLVVRREEVEEYLGRPWDTRDLGQVVSAYHGYLAKWDEDVVVLSWDPDDDGEAA